MRHYVFCKVIIYIIFLFLSANQFVVRLLFLLSCTVYSFYVLINNPANELIFFVVTYSITKLIYSLNINLKVI